MTIFDVVIRKEVTFRGTVEASDEGDAYRAALRAMESNALDMEGGDPLVWVKARAIGSNP